MLLQPFIENHLISSVQFISDQNDKALWQSDVMPKVATCPGGDKVKEPLWCTLPETVSFILVETAPDGRAEALLSFWGEPFMARTADASIPRYVFHIQEHSELLIRLKELERSCRIRT